MHHQPDLLNVRVSRRTREAEDIDSFELVAADGAALPAFSAGAHVDVVLGPALVRQYSLCNAPSETHRYLIAVMRAPASRGGSQAMHERIREGQQLRISPPRNHFALAPAAKAHLLLAGGIGITPILCMAEQLAAAALPFEMHYGTRSRARTAFESHIAQAGFAAQVHFHFDDGPPGQKLDLQTLLARPQEGLHLSVCGPQGFMEAALATARAAGWPPSQIHYEFFGAAPVASATGASFDVVLSRCGRVVTVPQEQTVVQALAQAGIAVPVSCEQGVCGTCLTRVLDGVPDHRDMFLTPDEQARNDHFLPCCSRAKSARLVLDL
ncbi:MAG TPA: PDR/VanB family oxidoreductase [Pseudorhodoferax sp.]|jgi:vanillate O-demethylase ferredoxin subunit|nr:PDR/VanB family oxidoreductase [Pseudorhodoferax sp.]